MKLLNDDNHTRELLRNLTGFLQHWTGCEAVGVRLREGDDFPYFETRGFPPEFVQLENQLCSRDADGGLVRDLGGNPVLECMCGNVLCGRFDPALPFFTAKGSFWTNSTSHLLASTSEADRQARTRNRCNGEGYESVALIALRHHGETIGLLQANDSVKDRFTPDLIGFLENAADQIALALAQRQTRAAVCQSERRFRSLFENMLNGVAYCRMFFDKGCPQDFVYLDVNNAFETLTGLKNVVGKKVSQVIPGLRESDPGLFAVYGRVALSGVPERFETYLNALGDWFAVSVYSPSPEHFVALFDVITVRKRAEAALLTSEARYRKLFHDSPIALRESDYSDVKRYFDQLRGAGVTDFREYFRSHPEAVRQCAAKVKILGVNQAALDLHHATSAEEILASLLAVFTDETDDFFREALTMIANGTTVFSQDTVMRTLQGEKRYVQLRWAAAPGCEETLARVYISYLDITERKQLQEKVALRERQLKSFFRGATAGLALLDKDLRYLQINSTLAEMNGVAVKEHIGKTVREIVPWLAPVVEPILQKVLASGEPVLNVEFDGETRSQPGIWRHWMASFFPMAGSDGNPDGVGSLVVEITERKKAEERQGRMLKRLKRVNLLQENLLLPGTLDEKFKQIANAAVELLDLDFCRIWIVQPGNLCQRGCMHATATEPGDLCRQREQCLHLIASAGRYTHTDGSHRRVPLGRHKIGRIATGQERELLTNRVTTDPGVADHAWARRLGLVSFAGYKLDDANGKPLGVLAAFAKHSISDEDHAFLSNLAETTSKVILESKVEEELRAKSKQAEAANRAKSEFLANMSHEIRTPMTAVLGFSDLLASGNLTFQERQQFLAGIRRNGTALLDLINDILDLSRIEADKLVLERVDCSLRQIIDD